jgi:glycyl-tRNA synthetase beta chain
MAGFLFEIGLEEVPARMIAGAQAELAKRTMALLERERLVAEGTVCKSYSTPRRLAVWVAEVAARQEDVSEELLGPAVKIAYKDGVPGPAAIAFAKKAGVAVDALKTVTTAKGEYIAATSVKAGRSASEVIAEELPKELAGIYWAKNMYWRAGKPERFVRPVRWMVALLGNAVVPVSFAGKVAGRETFGHRVLAGAAAIEMGAPGEYEQALLDAHVIADVEARRHKIRKALDHVCRTIPGARWREDHALVDKLTHLTEWPSVIAGSFEAEYLALPEEVLVTVMRDHQSYFAVEQGSGSRAQGPGKEETGKLAAHFLAVLNTETDAAGEAVILHGNERVLRARFNDARFFWEFDQRVKLVERVELLKNVTFQKDLGSYWAKTERVRAVAARLNPTDWNAMTDRARSAVTAARLHDGSRLTADASALDQAALLAKADLTTELVKEFTELQGEVGGLYARAQGVSEAAAAAIYDQYRPVGAGDRIPRTVEGQLLAIADKADTIAGMFGLGLEPTGSKDPFALRRAANGVVKILAESALPLTLGDVADAATGDEAVRLRVEVFFAERLEAYLRDEKGQAYDVVKAVLAAGANDVRDAVARAEAVTAVRGSDDFVAVSAAFKRMKNILAQAEEKGFFEVKVEPPSHVLEVDLAQSALHAAAQGIAEKFHALAVEHEYVAALELIATLRPQIDLFFEKVMVMVEDPYLRWTRLSLLQGLVENFSKIADFSEIVTQG